MVDNTLFGKYMIKIKLDFLPNDTVSNIVLAQDRQDNCIFFL